MNRSLPAIAALVALCSLGACSRSNNRPADTSLNTDLSLAAQQKNYQPLDSISAAERAQSLAANPAGTNAIGAARTSNGEVTHTATRSTVRHRSSGSSSGGSVGSSSGTVYTQPAPTVVKHTQRDAAIGAAAGAVIGATTSHNKVKGGIIGAAVGGILGGVIGNNVDKTKKP